MIDWKAVKKFSKLSAQKQEMTLKDRYAIADTMRENLASDITNGRYKLYQVTSQMVRIQDYEETTDCMETTCKKQ